MGKKEKEIKRVVIDTNVMVSALLFKGSLSKIVDHWKEGKIIPLLSKETFNEFKTVLEYPKFSLTAQEIKTIIEEEVLPYFEVTDIVNRVKGACRDSDDDKFIACAVSAAADFIVSGDRDLLDMGKYKSVKIISASEFLKIF
jgi:putative PIN family toxin of toxin-antitoxin system